MDSTAWKRVSPKTSPAARYAVYTHHGPAATLPASFDAMCQEMAAAHLTGTAIEEYPPDFTDSADATIERHIALQ